MNRWLLKTEPSDYSYDDLDDATTDHHHDNSGTDHHHDDARTYNHHIHHHDARADDHGPAGLHGATRREVPALLRPAAAAQLLTRRHGQL